MSEDLVPEYGSAGVASTHIQWKGTAVCMDVICECGEGLHFDTWFAYHIGCHLCGRVYEVGHSVALRPTTEAEVAKEWGEDAVKWGDCRNWWNA